MTNLNSILKEMRDLKKMEGFVTYQFLAQYYDIPISKKVISKKIQALGERKEEAEIEDSVFNAVIQQLTRQTIRAPLFQRQLLRDLLQAPKVIHYTLNPSLFQSRKRKTAKSWYSAIQKELPYKETKEKNDDDNVNERLDGLTTMSRSSKKPQAKGRNCQYSKSDRVIPHNKTKTHFKGYSYSSIVNFTSSRHQEFNEKKSPRNRETKRSKIMISGDKGSRNRANFNLSHSPIVSLTSLSSKIDEDQKVHNALTHQAKELPYYGDIARDRINPAKSFTIRTPHCPIQPLKIFHLNPKPQLIKSEVKDYLSRITLRRSNSNKKKLFLILKPESQIRLPTKKLNNR